MKTALFFFLGTFIALISGQEYDVCFIQDVNAVNLPLVNAQGVAAGPIESELIYNPDRNEYLAVWVNQVGELSQNQTVTTDLVVTRVDPSGSRMSDIDFPIYSSSTFPGAKRNPHGVYNPLTQQYFITWQYDTAVNNTNPDFDVLGFLLSSDGLPDVGATPVVIGGFDGNEGDSHVTFNPDMEEYAVSFEVAEIENVSVSDSGYNIHVARLNMVTLAELSQNVYFTFEEDRRPFITYDPPSQAYILGLDTIDPLNNSSDINIVRISPTSGAILSIYNNGATINGAPTHDFEVQIVVSQREEEIFAVWEVDLFGSGTEVGNQTVFAGQILGVENGELTAVQSVFIFSNQLRNFNPDLIWIEQHNHFGIYFESDNGTEDSAIIIGGTLRSSNLELLSSSLIAPDGQERHPEIAWNSVEDEIGLMWLSGPAFEPPNLDPNDQINPNAKRSQPPVPMDRSFAQSASPMTIAAPTAQLDLLTKAAFETTQASRRSTKLTPTSRLQTAPLTQHQNQVRAKHAAMLQSQVTAPQVEDLRLRVHQKSASVRRQADAVDTSDLRFNRLCFSGSGEGLSGGEIAGIVIAVIIGCCVCVMLIGCVIGLVRKKSVPTIAIGPSKQDRKVEGKHIELEESQTHESSSSSSPDSDNE